MRLTMLFLLGACGGDDDTALEDQEPACELTWYLDADGDGYGDPNTNGIVGCSPDINTGFVADNQNDCDDSNEAVTWGSTCPDAFLTGCVASVTQYAIGNRDYLVMGPSPSDPTDAGCVVLPTAVDAMCAMWSPDATPLAPNDASEFGGIKDHIPGDYNALWIDAVAVDGVWQWPATGLSLSDMGGFCDNISEPSTDPAATHLALVKRKLAGDSVANTCVGSPEQVWGLYFKDVVTAVDGDGDGLPNSSDPDPGEFDVDQDGLGDGHEVDVMGTDPEVNDGFPLRVPTPPTVAFDNAHAFLACERAR